ncbi:hypothetical protein B0H19DRAFT_1082655 [Mycena capillaripes]|nr:hypothetical protein B0H19DRAFT_1082655 [Mycena capillaripes]
MSTTKLGRFFGGLGEGLEPSGARAKCPEPAGCIIDLVKTTPIIGGFAALAGLVRFIFHLVMTSFEALLLPSRYIPEIFDGSYHTFDRRRDYASFEQDTVHVLKCVPAELWEELGTHSTTKFKIRTPNLTSVRFGEFSEPRTGPGVRFSLEFRTGLNLKRFDWNLKILTMGRG